MSESITELRPGQKINILCLGTVQTAFGEKTQETVHTLTYEEILEKFQNQTRPARRPNKTNQEAREFSKQCTLLREALENGKWRTGASVDPTVVIKRLVNRFATLKTESLQDISSNSLSSLTKMIEITTNTEHKQALTNILTQLTTALT